MLKNITYNYKIKIATNNYFTLLLNSYFLYNFIK